MPSGFSFSELKQHYQKQYPCNRSLKNLMSDKDRACENLDAHRNVEVLYDDWKWYCGWLDTFNFVLESQWIV